MTDTTQSEKRLTGYIDDLDERLLRVEDRITDVEIALENEKHQRRIMRDGVMERIDQRQDEATHLTERLNFERDALNLTMSLVLLHLAWHAVAKSVDWWRYR